MKKTLVICTALLAVLGLSACSSQPALTHTHKPILNISAELNPLLDVSLSSTEAWLKNKSTQSLSVQYDVYWYDQNGVTQPFSDSQEALRRTLLLTPAQKHTIQLHKPTPQSENYRLYLQQK
ncbi:hypothetical protein A4G18_06755 [Pasteurellaceae bacterium Pebbles2]|nr:hypothetical protein [Pasteurellaceae bacterium Pebbles2]